jgi:hypothetical protein
MLRLMPAPPDWRWKSRNLGGRPPIDAGLRVLRRLGSSEPRGLLSDSCETAKRRL